jgi:hypothetical protein
MARSRDQGYLLRKSVNRYAKPAMVTSHIRGDYTARDCSLMRATPRYPSRTDVGAELDEALPCKLIEVEL